MRKALEMTQADLAEQLSQAGKSYAQSTVAKIEKATRPTSVEEIIGLALILGVEVADLFDAGPVGLEAELKAAERHVYETQTQLDLWQSRIRDMEASLQVLIEDRDEIAAEIRAQKLREGGDDGVDQ